MDIQHLFDFEQTPERYCLIEGQPATLTKLIVLTDALAFDESYRRTGCLPRNLGRSRHAVTEKG